MKNKLIFGAAVAGVVLPGFLYFSGASKPNPTDLAAALRWTTTQIKDMVTRGQIDPEFQKFFDRDPERTVPNEQNIIVAPADGVVEKIFTDADGININISLSYFDIHVQRVPISGHVVSIRSVGSGYFKAKDPQYLNGVQTVTTLDTVIGSVTVKQLTSLFTKRILTYPKVGDQVRIGDRLGRILLGSTVILILPDTVTVTTKVGDQIYGAETIIARY